MWRPFQSATLTLPMSLRILCLVIWLISATSSPCAGQWRLISYDFLTVNCLEYYGSTLYAGTPVTGLWATSDHGTSWTEPNSGLGGGYVLSLLHTGTSLLCGLMDGGVYRSTNNGATWAAANQGLNDNRVLMLAAHAGDFYAFVEGWGLFRYHGGLWNADNAYLGSSPTLAFVASKTNRYAGTQRDGVFRSRNASPARWGAINSGLANTSVYALALIDTNVFAGTDGGVFVRKDSSSRADSGKVWRPALSGITDTRIRCLASSGTNLYAGTRYGGVFMTTDLGGSWNAVNQGLNHLDVRSLAFKGTDLFAGTDGGVYRLDNQGTSWIAVNAGLANLNVTSLAATGADIFAGTSGGGVFRSSDNGTQWTAVNSGVRCLDISCLSAEAGVLIAGSLGDGAYLTSDGGATWSPDPIYFHRSIWALVTDGLFVYAAVDNPGTIKRSSDDGVSWTTPTSSDFNADILSLVQSGTDIFGAGYYVFRSTDQGASWASCGLEDATTVALSDGNLVAGCYPGDIFVSSDRGQSWGKANGGPFWSPLDIAVSGSNLFMGHGYGVALSTDAGLSWRDANAGLPETMFFRSIAIDGDNVFVAAGDKGVWQRSISEILTTIDPLSQGIPQSVSLHQNYPNPFNPSTTIRYGLPSRSHVVLTVYNTLGQQVATLVQGEQEAGFHEAVFDASGLASGVYLYRLQAGDFLQTKRLLLLR